MVSITVVVGLVVALIVGFATAGPDKTKYPKKHYPGEPPTY